MKKITIFFLLTAFGFFLFSCEKNDEKKVEPEKENSTATMMGMAPCMKSCSKLMEKLGDLRKDGDPIEHLKTIQPLERWIASRCPVICRKNPEQFKEFQSCLEEAPDMAAAAKCVKK